MAKLTKIEFEKAQEKYIEEGISWEDCDNTVIQAEQEDVEQFACDSFHAGVLFMVQKYGIEWIK